MTHSAENEAIQTIGILTEMNSGNYEEHIVTAVKALMNTAGIYTEVSLLDDWLPPGTKLFLTSAPPHETHTNDSKTCSTNDMPTSTNFDTMNITSNPSSGKHITPKIDSLHDTTGHTDNTMDPDTLFDSNHCRYDSTKIVTSSPTMKNVSGAITADVKHNPSDDTGCIAQNVTTSPQPSTSPLMAHRQQNTQTLRTSSYDVPPLSITEQNDRKKKRNPNSDGAVPNDTVDKCTPRTRNDNTTGTAKPMHRYVTTIPVCDHTLQIEYDAAMPYAERVPRLLSDLDRDLSEHNMDTAFLRLLFKVLIVKNGYDFDFTNTPSDNAALIKNTAYLITNDKSFAATLVDRFSV